MLLTIKDKKVNFIGDPHMGRKFNNVPLHRRGDREAIQLAEFIEQMNVDCDLNIMVGDLFDTFIVSNEILSEVYKIIYQASLSHPKTRYVLMSGNHDISRDSGVISSFQILEEMVSWIDNVTVCMTDAEIILPGLCGLVCPYSPFEDAATVVGKWKQMGCQYDFVVGHWDIDEIAGTHNLVPLPILKDMTPLILTGHVHGKREAYVDILGGLTEEETDVRFIGVGSMQPYAHGEDTEGKMYVTMTIEQVNQILATDPEFFREKSLRMIVAPGDEPPEVDCLQFQLKKVDTQAEKLEVTMTEFSFQSLFNEVMKENNVSDEIRDHYWDLYREKASDDQQS